MSSGPDDGQRDEELAEVELLGQDFLDVLLTLNRKSAVGHHEVDT
jgi:hypothetical protein